MFHNCILSTHVSGQLTSGIIFPQDKYHSPGSDCGCSLCSWKIIKDLRSENDALRQRYSSMQTEIAKLVVAYLLLCYLCSHD